MYPLFQAKLNPILRTVSKVHSGQCKLCAQRSGLRSWDAGGVRRSGNAKKQRYGLLIDLIPREWLQVVTCLDVGTIYSSN